MYSSFLKEIHIILQNKNICSYDLRISIFMVINFGYCIFLLGKYFLSKLSGTVLESEKHLHQVNEVKIVTRK